MSSYPHSLARALSVQNTSAVRLITLLLFVDALSSFSLLFAALAAAADAATIASLLSTSSSTMFSSSFSSSAMSETGAFSASSVFSYSMIRLCISLLSRSSSIFTHACKWTVIVLFLASSAYFSSSRSIFEGIPNIFCEKISRPNDRTPNFFFLFSFSLLCAGVVAGAPLPA